MKWIVGGLSAACVIISICIIAIVRSGVSIRTAPLIKPTAIQGDPQIIGEHLSLRLFPDLQSTHYWLWGVDRQNPEVTTTLETMKVAYQKRFQRPIHELEASTATTEMVRDCPQPCWIYTDDKKAHELETNPFIEKFIHPTQKDYRTVSWIETPRKVAVPSHCVEEKRLSFDCLAKVSMHEVERKMKSPHPRHFFLRKYLDHDLFVFIVTD